MGCSHMQPDGIHCNTPPHLSSISIIGSRVCQWLPHISPTFISSSLFVCIIISFRPAWLARALLSFKRAQSSGNDDVDERQHTPFGALMVVGVYVISLVSFLNLISIKAGIPRYE